MTENKLTEDDEIYYPKFGWMKIREAKERGLLTEIIVVEETKKPTLKHPVISLSPEIDFKVLEEAKRQFAASFHLKPDSWFIRCVERFEDITEERIGIIYVVAGRPKFGDKYSKYTIKYKGIDSFGEDKFFCPCMIPAKRGGAKRERILCTHVGVVILFRIYQKLLKKQTQKLNTSITINDS